MRLSMCSLSLSSREIAGSAAIARVCRCTIPRMAHSTPINMIRPETLIAFYLSLRLEIAAQSVPTHP